MDNTPHNKFQITKGSPGLRLREILMDSDGLLTLVKLNVLFLFTTLPFIPFFLLITGGGSFTALLYFKRTFIVGMILSLTSVVLIAGLVIYLTMAGSNIIYIPMASVSLLALIFIWSVAVHLFPAFTEEENSNKTAKELFKESVSLIFAKMKETLVAVIISVIVIFGIILMLPKTLPLLLVMIFSVPALAAGFAHSDAEFISDII